MDSPLYELLDMLGVLPVEVVVTYAYTKMLRFRSDRVFWTVRMSLIVLLCYFRSAMDPGVRMAVGAAITIFLPLLLSQDKLSSRVFVIVLVNVVLAIAEIAGAALWLALSGTPLVDQDTFAFSSGVADYWTVRLVHLLLAIMLLSGLYAVLRRFSASEQEGMRFFVVLPLTQVVLLSVSLAIMQYLPHQSDLFNYGNLVLAAVCVVVDCFLFVSMGRYGMRQRSEQRAALLQCELDDYLHEYRVVVEDMEAVARLRHDLRNQLQVATELAEDGKSEEALNLLADMKSAVNALDAEGERR